MPTNYVRQQRIDGANNVDRFGSYSVEVDGEAIIGATFEIGDVNHDSYLDLVVGACFAENGENVGDFFGATVHLVDIDGDGRLDLVAGAPGVDFAGTNTGSVFIFLNQGAPNYFLLTPVVPIAALMGMKPSENLVAILRPEILTEIIAPIW